jgi:peptide/nickel transport system substrate-binding protein
VQGYCVKRLGAIAIVIAAIALTLSGCGSGKAPSSTSKDATSLTFIIDMGAWPALDPASSASESGEDPIYSLIYGNLFTVGPGDKPVPDLATGYSWSSNDLTLTLHLRSGVKFQDGTPFNATAVKDSLERDSRPRSAAPARPRCRPSSRSRRRRRRKL